MMSVSRSLAFLLSIDEMSSGLRGRLSGVWSAAPTPPRDLRPYQPRAHSWACCCPPQTAFLSSHPRCHLSARRCFLTWLAAITPSFHLPASVSLTSLTLCVFSFLIPPLFHFCHFGSSLHFPTSIQIPPSPRNHPWLFKPEFSFSQEYSRLLDSSGFLL